MEERDWGSLPPDLLALVVDKVEEGAGARGEGRRLVALAGVCRAWRRSVHQERQRSPLLTFPAAIRQPGCNMKCMLKKSGNTFRLVQRRICGDEYFLLGARKKRTIRSSHFRISADPKLLWIQTHEDAVALKSNFWRTTFTAANPQMLLSVRFQEVAVDGNCQRTMRCELGPHVRRDLKAEAGWQPSWFTAMLERNKLSCPSYKSSKRFLGSSYSDLVKSSSVNDRMTCSLKSKDPDWHEQEQCWSLDFTGRTSSIVASIHNFQLVSSDSTDGRVILQLGKLCKGLFVLDFGAPLSPLEAFAIALSSFATSVGLDT